MSDVEILRFMRAIWPTASDVDIGRIDPHVAIRTATALLLDQRTRLADIHQAAHLRGSQPEAAARIQDALMREGPASIGGRPLERKPLRAGQALWWIDAKRAKRYGYKDRVPVVSVVIDAKRRNPVEVRFVAFPGQTHERVRTSWVSAALLDPREVGDTPLPEPECEPRLSLPAVRHRLACSATSLRKLQQLGLLAPPRPAMMNAMVYWPEQEIVQFMTECVVRSRGDISQELRDALAVDHFIRAPEVRKRVRLTRKQIDWREYVGKFPGRIRVGERICVWLDSEIEEYRAQRQAARRPRASQSPMRQHIRTTGECRADSVVEE